MPPIVTAGQMRNIDKRAIEGMGIPGLDLMEAAGRGVAEHVRDDLLQYKLSSILLKT